MPTNQAGDDPDENLPAAGDSLREQPDDVIRAAQRAALAPLGKTVNQLFAKDNTAFAKLLDVPSVAKLLDVPSVGKLLNVPSAADVMPGLKAFDDQFWMKNAALAKLVAVPSFAVPMPAMKAVSSLFAEQTDQFAKLATVTLPALELPSVDNFSRSFAAQYEVLVKQLEDPLPDSTSSIASTIADLGDALERLERSAPDDDGGKGVDPGDEFNATIDAFIAVGLAGRDLIVNTTVLAWLMVVRQVDQVWGRKLARQALAIFITVAVTLTLTAWMVVEGDQPLSVAVVAAVGTPVSILTTVWGKLGGE